MRERSAMDLISVVWEVRPERAARPPPRAGGSGVPDPYKMGTGTREPCHARARPGVCRTTHVGATRYRAYRPCGAANSPRTARRAAGSAAGPDDAGQAQDRDRDIAWGSVVRFPRSAEAFQRRRQETGPIGLSRVPVLPSTRRRSRNRTENGGRQESLVSTIVLTPLG